MAYQAWQKFITGRAPNSIFCFRVRWSDGSRPVGGGRGGRGAARISPAPPPPLRPAAKRGPHTLVLRSIPTSLAPPTAPLQQPADQAIPLPGRLKKWLTENCRGTWSMNRMHGGRVCILGFESSSDYARAVGFLAPNGPWRPSGMPACAAGRTTDVDAARLERLFAPGAAAKP